MNINGKVNGLYYSICNSSFTRSNEKKYVILSTRYSVLKVVRSKIRLNQILSAKSTFMVSNTWTPDDFKQYFVSYLYNGSQFWGLATTTLKCSSKVEIYVIWNNITI